MKYLLVIGDGMAERPLPELGGRTPLEAAATPCMDELCAHGELGLVRTIPDGVAPGSDAGILSIFSYDPRRFFTGRSPLEAAGCGVLLKADELSYRCNMVHISDDAEDFSARLMRSHSGGSIEGEESIALLNYLLADADFAAALGELRFYPTPSFRHILVQKGGTLAGFHATPPHDILDQPIGAYLPKGPGSEKLIELMRLSARILPNAPVNRAREARGLLSANCIWPWAEGTATQLSPAFAEKFGKKGMVISAVPLVQGIAALAGLAAPTIPGATGELDTNYAGKREAAAEALAGDYDFVCVHIEAPDECTHCGDLPGKKQAIENVDQLILRPLAEQLAQSGESYRILVMPDHQTLLPTRTHGAEPIPYFIFDSRGGTQSGLTYGESSAAKTGLYLPEGAELMARFLG